MSESLPRNKCGVCGYWFTTAGDEAVCSDCREGMDEERAERGKAGTWDDPYRELREFVDPKTGGGPLDPKFRRQIGELLRFRDEFRAAVVIKEADTPAYPLED